MSIPSCPARLSRDENIQILWPVAAQSGSPLLPRLIAWAESGGTVDEIAAIYSEAREAIGVAIADHDADPEYASAAGYEWGPDNDSSHADITATAAALAAVAAAAWSAAACAAAEAAAAAERARREAITSHPAYVAAQAIHGLLDSLPARIVWFDTAGSATAGYIEARDFIRLDLLRHAESAIDPSSPDGWGTYRDPSRAWISRHVAALRALSGSTYPCAGYEAEYASTVAAATEIADRLEALIAMLPPVSPEDARVSAVRRAIAREVSARPVAGPVAGPLRSALLAWRGDRAGIEQICAEADAAADAERLDAGDDIDECWAPFRDDLPAAVAAMIAGNALSATHDGSSLDDRISPEAITSFISLWGHPIGS